MLSNDYFLRCGRWYTGIGGLCALRPGEDRLITPLPMTHVNAMAYSTLAMVMTGGCIIPLDRFHPRSWWQTVRDSRATIMHSLGVMPTMLLGLDASPDDRAHHVRFGFAPGVDPRYHAAFEQRFGIPMIDAWAMTETGAGAVVIASHEPRHIGRSCFGRAQPFMQYRIVDEADADVADGTPGELLVRAAGADPRAGFFTEVSRRSRSHRSGLGRRLVPHRRRGAAGRGKEPVLRRSPEERDPPQRREHRRRRSRKRPAAAPAGARCGVRRRAR